MALLFVGFAVVSPVDPASASHIIPCGTTITADTKLQANVGPCPSGNGLIVSGGSDIDLNLNGYRVFSNSPLPRNVGVDGNGVYIPADVVGVKILNSTGVTVRNGVISGFNAGVSIENGSNNIVKNLTIKDNQSACVGEDFSSFVPGNYGDGVVVFGSQNNQIMNNLIRNNGPFSGIAIVANTEFITRAVPPYPSGNIIKGNLVADNNICFANIGIRVEGPGATDTQVLNNTVKNSFQEGITVHSVNTIDFRPLFQNPPQCQNRGFPTTHVGTFTAGSNVVTVTGGDISTIDVGDPVSAESPSPVAGGTTVAAVNSPAAGQITLSLNATQTVSGKAFGVLPMCPLQNPTNPTNDRVILKGNNVTGNGFGGPRINAGPNLPNAPQFESAAGINLLSFCGFGARADATGTVVKDNRSVGNAGDGITAGGCPVGQDPANGTFPGFQNSEIKFNVALDNNQAGCGTLPARPGCGSRPASPRFDLRDTTNLITCPSTSATTQAICAGLGYAPPPASPTPFVGTPVVHPSGTPCGTNTWFGNKYGTAFPACTTIGGKQVTPPPPPPAGLRTAQAASAASSSDGSGDTSRSYTVRGGKR